MSTAFRQAVPEPDLVAAAVDLMREAGLAQITQRAVAARAGVPAATLQHRFAGKDEMLRQLFGRLFGEAERALRQLAEGPARPPLPPASACALLTSFVVAPGRDTPALLEGLAQAVRSPVGRPAAQSWLSALQALWRRLLVEHGSDVDNAAWFLVELQIGILLLSLGGGRPQETALANAELARFACFGPEAANGEWYGRLIRAEAGLLSQAALPEPGPERGRLLQRLLEAGVAIVARSGADELSFRTLAARAGTSLSAVTHHFPRRDQLLYAVYRHIHDLLTGTSAPAAQADPAGHFVASVTGSEAAGAPLFLVSTELSLAAARIPAFADMAWMIRVTRGGHVAPPGDPSFDPAGRHAFALHARSLWQTGCALVQAARVPADELPALLRRRHGFAERAFRNGLFAALR